MIFDNTAYQQTCSFFYFRYGFSVDNQDEKSILGVVADIPTFIDTSVLSVYIDLSHEKSRPYILSIESCLFNRDTYDGLL